MLDYRKLYLGKLDHKEKQQERNIYGIVQYAKKIAAEI